MRSRPIDYAAASPEDLRALIDSPPADRTRRAAYHIRDRARAELARRGLAAPAPERAPAAARLRDHHGQKVTVPRNGLPEFTPYVTRQVRDYYASQGITLRGRSYQGTGHDMTGDCLCGTKCPWAPRESDPHAPRGYRVPDADLIARINGPAGPRRDKASHELRRRQAERRASLADAS